MGGLIVKLKTWWETADRTQRTVSTVGGGFLLLLIIGTYIFASKPHMSVLASGLSPSEQGQIMDALQKEGVVTELGAGGDVMVPDNRVTDLRAKLAMQGKLPANGHATADDDLSKISFTSTPSVERERLKALAEARIESSIESLDNIESAQVHIALGSDSAFVSEKKSATASVTIAEKAGSIITPDQAHGIASLVASSVQGLDLNSVTVLNRAGVAIVDPSEAGSARGKIASQLDTQNSEAKKREREIQQKLDTVFGAGNTVASVDLQIDFDSKSYTATVHKNPATPIMASETKETMNGGATGSLPGGVTGARANQPGAPGTIGAGSAADNSYKNEAKEYLPITNDTTTVGENNAGQIKSMAISVIVAKDKVKPEVVQSILKGYLGPRVADPTNFTATVTESEFDTSATKLAAASVSASASRDRMQQIFSLLPVGALFIVGFMVMKALGKLPQPMMLATSGGMLSIPGRGIDMDAATAAKFGLTDSGGGVNKNAQALGTGAQGSGTGITFSSDGSAMRAPGSILEDPDIEIESIKRRVNVPLEQIKRMSEEKPEVVAMLIKSWLMEERG